MMDSTLDRISKCNLFVAAAYLLVSLVFRSAPKTVGIAIGAALMTANFYVMSVLVKKALAGGKLKALPFVLYIVKILVLFGLAFLVLKWDFVSKIFFLAGTTVILPSFLIVSLMPGRPREEGKTGS